MFPINQVNTMQIQTTLNQNPLGRYAPGSSYSYSPTKKATTTSNASQQVATAPTSKTYTQAQKSSPTQGVMSPPAQQITSQAPEQTSSAIQGLIKYPDIVRDTVRASTPSGTQTRIVRDIQDTAGSNTAIGDEARAIAERYGAEIARIGQLGAGAVAGNLSTGTSPVGSGNAAIASQSASQRMSALGQGLSAELEGTGQQLTAAQQRANAQNMALGGSNVQQQQQLGGLGLAGGLAQPVQVAPGSTLASPLSGDTVAGGLGGYVNYNTAEQVMGLISQYPDAGYQYNPALTPQQNLTLAQQAIQGSPSYQKGTFGAPGSDTFLGGQGMQTAAKLQSDSAILQAQAGAAEANFQLLLNIAQQGGVNKTNVPILNTLQRNVARGVTSSEAVATFNSVIQSVRAQYASILGGGTPTDATRREAEAQIPNDLSLSALQSIGHALEAEAQNRIVGYNQQIQALSSQSSQGGATGPITWDNIPI